MQRYRKRYSALVLVLSLLILTLQGAMTHAQTMFQGYTTGVQIANVLSSDTTVTLTAYNSDGSTINLGSIPSLPTSSKSFFPITSSSLSGSLRSD